MGVRESQCPVWPDNTTEVHRGYSGTDRMELPYAGEGLIDSCVPLPPEAAHPFIVRSEG